MTLPNRSKSKLILLTLFTLCEFFGLIAIKFVLDITYFQAFLLAISFAAIASGVWLSIFTMFGTWTIEEIEKDE